MISHLLNEQNINIVDDISSWKEAIYLVCKPLIESHDIQPEYVGAIIKSTQELGPYYVLAPMIAMPHARPENGVNNNALSLLVVRNGVEFHSEDNDPVKIILLLAAKDSNQHIELITSISKFFCSEGDILDVSKATDVEQITEILKNIED
ncbi:PTS sugar transporter subunit IIA [Aeromonas jandaei]